MDVSALRHLFYAESFLLRYPDAAWRGQASEVIAALQGMKTAELAQTLAAAAEQLLASRAADDLEKLYVETFDFGKQTNLYLTYAEFGETKERGAALLGLQQQYEEAGFVLKGGELPDYLPVMLEFAAMADAEACARVFAPLLPALREILRGLAAGNSPYCAIFRAIVATVGQMALANEPIGGVCP
ncbi:MAG TPA: nitrate reductase molybdenum cofactor assembly chaperone [Bacilli bacterium]